MTKDHVERLKDARQRVSNEGWYYNDGHGYGAITAIASNRGEVTLETFRFSGECAQYILRAAQENADFAGFSEPEKFVTNVRFAVWERAQGNKEVVLAIMTRAIELAEAEA